MNYSVKVNIDLQDAYDNLTVNAQRQFIMDNIDKPFINDIIDYLISIGYTVN